MTNNHPTEGSVVMKRRDVFRRPPAWPRHWGLLEEYSGRATLLAGGTDLVPRINYYDINSGCPALHRRDRPVLHQGEKAAQFSFGAGTLPLHGVGRKRDCLMEKADGPLCSAAGLFREHVEVRNCGPTIGGNLGNASPAADLATPLLAMDAEFKLGRKRRHALRCPQCQDFFQGTGRRRFMGPV